MLPPYLGLSLLGEGMEHTIHLNFLEEFLVLRLVPDGPDKSGCSQTLSSSILTVPSVTKKMTLFSDVNTSFEFRLLKWNSHASSSSNSFLSATTMSPFQILPTYNTNPRNIHGKTFGPN